MAWPRRPLSDAGRSALEAPPLHAVRLHDRWVILDAACGAYLTIYDPVADLGLDAEGRLRAESLNQENASELAGLVGRRVEIAPSPPSQGDYADTDTPQRSRVGASALDVVRCAAALFSTAWDLTRPFDDLVRPRPLLTRRDDEAGRQAALFARMVVWFPWQGECLFRSRWLLRYLQLQGCSADWVFGVRGWPLRAHCWVRTGARLLNETQGSVAAFRVLGVF